MRADSVRVTMGMAELIALRGTCDRLQVGAIITRDNRVISSGYNGNVAGTDHCRHSEDGLYLPPTAGCTTAVHAEANAIVFAARHGARVDQADLWSTHQPCLGCANLIINAGIGRVFYKHPYRLYDGIEALQSAGVAVFNVTEEYAVISMK